MKLVLVVLLILFGMFFNEHRILRNIDLLEAGGIAALASETFHENHSTLKIGMVTSVAGFVLVIAIAVYKPWMSPNETAHSQENVHRPK